MISNSSAKYAINTIDKIDMVLGVVKSPAKKNDKYIDDLIKQRIEARENKDWGKADKIRTQLDKIGIILEDTEKGTVWKKK